MKINNYFTYFLFTAISIINKYDDKYKILNIYFSAFISLYVK